MENGLLLTIPHRPILSCSIFVPQLQFLQLNNPHFNFTSHHLRFSFTVTPKCSSKWDSNAERVRARSFKFSFDRNGDEDDDDDDDDEKEEEEETLSGNVKKKKKRKWWSKKQPKVKMKRSGNVFDEVIESILILRVFKSFGLFLPAIIISFLLATGLKAFLMSFALSLALSALLFSFEKLGEKTQRRPKRKASIRWRTSSMYASSAEMEEEGDEVPKTRKAKMNDQSRGGSNNGAVKKQSEGVPDLGGWDFLDETRPMQGNSQVTSESQRTHKGKLSGNRRENEAPLLLRLLIAVFPFIGFWVKMFW